MARGRPADPTRARRGTGNRPIPGKDIVATPAPARLTAEAAPIFEIPEHLPEESKQLLERVIRELEPRGLREADYDALLMMAHAAYAHARAREIVQKTGVMIFVHGRPVPNPALRVARDEAATYIRIANEYGLTLAARLRLGLMQLAGESILASLNKELDEKARKA